MLAVPRVVLLLAAAAQAMHTRSIHLHLLMHWHYCNAMYIM